jgi:hypothetical protein
MNEMPPFWLAAIGLLIVLAFMGVFPRAGAALLGVLVLVLVLTAKKKGVV